MSCYDGAAGGGHAGLHPLQAGARRGPAGDGFSSGARPEVEQGQVGSDVSHLLGHPFPGFLAGDGKLSLGL